MTRKTPHWYDQAACTGLAPMFDYEPPMRATWKGRTENVAKRLAQRVRAERKELQPQLSVCRKCPVRRACLKDTVRFEQQTTSPQELALTTQGVRGGYTPSERMLWHWLQPHIRQKILNPQAAHQALNILREKDKK